MQNKVKEQAFGVCNTKKHPLGRFWENYVKVQWNFDVTNRYITETQYNKQHSSVQ